MNKKRIAYGSLIKERRKTLGMTQLELANELGKFQNTISNWESGNREPESIEDIKMLLKVLDCKFEDIFIND